MTDPDLTLVAALLDRSGSMRDDKYGLVREPAHRHRAAADPAATGNDRTTGWDRPLHQRDRQRWPPCTKTIARVRSPSSGPTSAVWRSTPIGGGPMGSHSPMPDRAA